MQSESYSELPRSEGNPRKSQHMPESKFTSFHSDFVGKTLQDLSGFLEGSPEDLQMDREYFVVLDGETKDKGTMILCKREDGEILSLRKPIEKANIYTGGMNLPGKFKEMLDNAEEASSYIGSMNLGHFEEMVEEAKKNLKHKPDYS